MSDVYLSYARADGAPHVRQLYNLLMDSGHMAWYDPPEGHVTEDDYGSILEARLLEADCVVLCVSAGAPDERLQREIVFAQSAQKPVILARFAGEPHPLVAHLTWLDFSDEQAASDELLALVENPPAFNPSSGQHPYQEHLDTLYLHVVRFLSQTITPLPVITGDALDWMATGPDAELPPMGTLPRSFKGKNINIVRRDATAFDPTDETDLEELIIMPKSFTRCKDALAEYGYRTILHGDRGTGKTTVLLTLVRQAVVTAVLDHKAPVPVLSMLGGWDAADPAQFVEWLSEHTRFLTVNQLNGLLEEGRLSLFLDGLDEMGTRRYEMIKVQMVDPRTGRPNILEVRDRDSGRRKKIIQETEQYRHYDPRERFMESLRAIPDSNRVIITAATDVFEQFAEQTGLESAIHLQNVLPHHISTYLSSMPELWQAIKDIEAMLELTRQPFVLNALIFAARELPDVIYESLEELTFQPADVLLDMVLRNYVQARHLTASTGQPIGLDAVYYVLGAAAFPAVEGQEDNPRPDYTEISYQELQNLHHEPEVFIEFAEAMRLLIHVRDDAEMLPVYRYVSPLLRDHFVPVACELLLYDENIQLRLRALRVLSLLRGTYVQRLVVRALDDEELMNELYTVNWDARTKGAVIAMFGRSGDPRALTPLITALGDSRGWVRQKAADALGELGDENALEPLKGALVRDVNADVRRSSMIALEKLKFDPVLNPVTEDML